MTAPYAPTMSAAGSRGAGAEDAAVRGTRTRWRMHAEARALVVVSAILVAVGLVVVYSASAFVGFEQRGSAQFFVVQQLRGVALGIVAFAIAAKFDAEHWKRLAWPIMLASLLGMLITVLPFTTGIAPEVNHSRRFIFGRAVQPAELAKLAVILWTPMLLVKKGAQLRRLGKGLAPFLVVVGALATMAMIQPDVSMAMTYLLLMAVLLFVGGARIGHFVFLGLLGVPILIELIRQKPYLVGRFLNFFATFSVETQAPLTTATATQQDQSLIAMGAGGLFGVGFGQGNQQRGWLPLAYNDFISSVVGEEFGFVGISVLVLMFSAYGWLGFRIAKQARTPYLGMVAVGLTFVTVITAFVHFAVAIKLLPNTGLTLPFISYGSSNLALTLLMTGILVNIGSERERVYGTGATDPTRRSS